MTSPFPPGPSALAALAGMRAIGGGGDLASVPRFFAATARRYGPVAHWRFGRRHFFLLDDAALIEEALVTRTPDFTKGRGVQRLRSLLGDGLLTSEEPRHLRRRRAIQPAFHRERIAGYGARMVAAAAARAASWSDGAHVVLDAEMAEITLRIAAETLFSSDLDAQAATIRAALGAALALFPATMSVAGELLDHLPFPPVMRRFRAARAALDAVISGLIAERRRGGDAHDDLLAMLLAARDEGTPLTDADVRDEAMTLFIAGHETTANALAWTWACLARSPAVEARLHAEVDGALGGRRATAQDLPALPFTRDVLAEAMRLYPPAWVLGRRARRATTLGPWPIPAGSVVIASQIVTHRNPRYFERPDDFRPERWAAAGDLPRFAYFPFGGGNRRCIGESFAWMEGVLVLATIAARWRFTLAGALPAAQPLVTLRPKTPLVAVAHARAPRAGAVQRLG